MLRPRNPQGGDYGVKGGASGLLPGQP